MQPKTVGYVDAVFDGAQVRMQIDRDRFPAFESVLRQPAYQTFTKFAGGLWNSADLSATLAFALIDWQAPDSKAALDSVDSFRSFAKLVPDHRLQFRIPKSVEARVFATLTRNPPAPYAALALKILEAALFGLPEKEAVFDESKIGEAA